MQVFLFYSIFWSNFIELLYFESLMSASFSFLSFGPTSLSCAALLYFEAVMSASFVLFVCLFVCLFISLTELMSCVVDRRHQEE